jgi:hypothetical protein
VILETSTQEILQRFGRKARKAKNTCLNVKGIVKIVEVQLSEDLYGHKIKHVADHLLKTVARSRDRVTHVA